MSNENDKNCFKQRDSHQKTHVNYVPRTMLRSRWLSSAWSAEILQPSPFVKLW